MQGDIDRYDLDITIKIPMVKVLKKKFKGKEHYDEVPLMLNYGFVRVPKDKITNPEYFTDLRHKVSCIVGFPKVLGEKTPTIATATIREVNRVMKMGKKLSIYTGHDFNTLGGRDTIRKLYEPHINDMGEFEDGKIINLKGYPFDGVDAQVCKIKFNKEEVDVLLQMGFGDEIVAKPVTISFHNLFYTIYDNHLTEEMREVSLEDIKAQTQDENIFDKIIYKAHGDNLSTTDLGNID
jgi:transcription antitermination factor NusG|tara:strand:+ start:374 stop:1084 length:711 start_codon:yes stop_codon:yes gene_type:complete